jgi:hypothetical protein
MSSLEIIYKGTLPKATPILTSGGRNCVLYQEVTSDEKKRFVLLVTTGGDNIQNIQLNLKFRQTIHIILISISHILYGPYSYCFLLLVVCIFNFASYLAFLFAKLESLSFHSTFTFSLKSLINPVYKMCIFTSSYQMICFYKILL